MEVIGLLFLLFIVGFLIYFIGGIVLMKIRGASGLELIPHYRFWIGVIMRLRSGVAWLLNGCKTQSEGYEEI